MKLTFQWRAAVKKREDKVKKEEGFEKGGGDEEEDINKDLEEEESKLLGPSAEYVPQEEIVLESSLEVAAFYQSTMYFPEEDTQTEHVSVRADYNYFNM